MTEKLHIEPRDAGERERLLAALEAEPARVLTIRCARGCRLARVASGTAGIVFAAEPWERLADPGVRIVEDGSSVGRRRLVREHLTDPETGAQIDSRELHSTLAMLGRDAEPVDLLVVCRHGATVLDAAAVRSWVADGHAPKVRTLDQAPEYVRPTLRGGERRTVSVARQIGGEAVSIDEMIHWLNEDTVSGDSR